MKEEVPSITVSIDEQSSVATIRKFSPNGNSSIIYQGKINNIIYPNGDYWRAYNTLELTSGDTIK